MAMSEAQGRRALRRAEIPWSPELKDPRDERNQRHAHHGLLAVLAVAFACGRTRLRQVEDLTEDLGAGARRRLGLAGRASDTTFYRVLSAQQTRGLRESLQAHVRRLIAAKVVRKDAFPIGAVAIDGKSFWSSSKAHVEGTKTSVDERTGVMTSSLMSLRAVLSSSQVCPCLDFEVIGDKEGEAPAFRVLFPRLLESFGGQFEVVTADAGLTCRENAAQVTSAGKAYLFALKGNQPKLFSLAEEMFAAHPGGLKARSAEPRNGATVVRELHTITVHDVESMDLPGATQLWRVTQMTTLHGAKEPAVEVRYFATSLPPTRLSPTQQLSLVRLHWAIENNHNWTMDVALSEDDVQPCRQSRVALEVVAWLRAIAFNLISAWRSGSTQKDRRPLPWGRSMEQLRDALLLCSERVLQATLA